MSFFAIVWFLFVFSLGAISAVVGAAVAAWYVLTQLKIKSDEQRKQLSEEAQAAAKEIQKAVPLLEPELKTQVRLTLGNPKKENKEYKTLPWNRAVIKTNMLFHFPGTQSTPSIARLDDCKITILKHPRKSRFHVKNCIQITAQNRPIFPTSTQDTCFLYFQSARELEEWFYAIDRATRLSARDAKETDYLQREQNYFTNLSATLTHTDPVNSDWVNALLARVFWGMHDHPELMNLLRTKLRAKVAKLRLPKFVQAVRVKDVSLGPNLPLFNNIRFHSVSPQGALNADAQVYYPGGFKLEIDIDLQVPMMEIVVPVNVSVTALSLSGRVNFRTAPPPAKKWWFGFYGEPRVDLDIQTHLGKDYKLPLTNVPSLTNIIVNKIKVQLLKKFVLPVMDDWPLPVLPKDFKFPTPSPKQPKATTSTTATTTSSPSSSPVPVSQSATLPSHTTSLPTIEDTGLRQRKSVTLTKEETPKSSPALSFTMSSNPPPVPKRPGAVEEMIEKSKPMTISNSTITSTAPAVTNNSPPTRPAPLVEIEKTKPVTINTPPSTTPAVANNSPPARTALADSSSELSNSSKTVTTTPNTAATNGTTATNVTPTATVTAPAKINPANDEEEESSSSSEEEEEEKHFKKFKPFPSQYRDTSPALLDYQRSSEIDDIFSADNNGVKPTMPKSIPFSVSGRKPTGEMKELGRLDKNS